jgi:hypothetical protein
VPDSARTLSALLPKLVESSALDAIDAGGVGMFAAGPRDASRFLDEVAQAEVERFDAVGEGEDLRLRHPQVAGGALLANGQVVHLCAFRVHAGESSGSRPQGSRLVRASQRRRGRLL